MLSVQEAAAILGVSSARVRELIAQGLLPATKMGRAWALREEDVFGRLERHPQSGRPRHASEERSEQARSEKASRFHALFLECRESFSVRASGGELASIADPEEAAFRVAVADFFLQRKQEELIRRGVF